MCIGIYIFNLKRQPSKKKHKNTKKGKEIEEEKGMSPENRLKKLNLWPPG